MSSFRIEAEAMTLAGGYGIESGSFASGGRFIGLTGASSGTASTIFSGQTGSYRVIVGYFDESDGNSSVTLRVGTQTFSWSFNNSPGGSRASAQNLKEYTLPQTLSIASGTQIVLEGLQNAGENARVDYIRFEPITSSPPPPTGSTADYSSATNGIIANLATEVVFKPLYGNLSKPKIMPLGDSITAGEHSIAPVPGAYRTQVWKRFSTDGLSLDFVGSKSNGPTGLGDKNHEGWSGKRINYITGLVNNGLMTTHQPDVVMLMIGTNDALGLRSVSAMQSDLSQLIDRITTSSPNTYLLVSSIAPISPDTSLPKGNPDAAQRAADYNAIIPNLVSQKASQGKKVFYANAGGSLTLNDINDGVHPSVAGYDKLGNAWYNKLIEKDTFTNLENVTGSPFSDTITGSTGANVIRGNSGNDLLTGGGSSDTFIYHSPTEGLDTITDWSSNDFFQILASGFGGGLRSGVALSTGASSTGVFVSGSNPNPIGSSANFLYNTSTGTLRFDRDGVGSGAAVDLAVLNGAPSLNANQFVIV